MPPAGLNNPLLAGNICSVFVSGLLLVIISYAFPDKTPFDWQDFKTKITTSEDKACVPFINSARRSLLGYDSAFHDLQVCTQMSRRVSHPSWPLSG